MPSFYAHCARHAHYFGFAHLDFVSFFSGSFELPHQEYWTQQRCLYLNPRTEAPPFGCSTSDHTPPSCGLFSDSYTRCGQTAPLYPSVPLVFFQTTHPLIHEAYQQSPEEARCPARHRTPIAIPPAWLRPRRVQAPPVLSLPACEAVQFAPRFLYMDYSYMDSSQFHFGLHCCCSSYSPPLRLSFLVSTDGCIIAYAILEFNAGVFVKNQVVVESLQFIFNT